MMRFIYIWYMNNSQKLLLKKVLEFFGDFSNSEGERYIKPDQNYLVQKIMFFKATAKAEDIPKSEYGFALIAFVLNELQSVQNTATSQDNTIADDFMMKYGVSAEDEAKILRYIEFLHSETEEQNKIEEILRDTQYLHLGMPDAFEKLGIQREKGERENNITYTELEWLEKCREYFIKHSFNCFYTISKFGNLRSKHFIDLEKRIDKLSGLQRIKLKVTAIQIF